MYNGWIVTALKYDIFSFREWYSYHFPELIKIVNDNYMYAKVAKYVKSRKDFTKEKLEGLEELVMDEGKAKAIYEASKSSMGEFETLKSPLKVQFINQYQSINQYLLFAFP